MKTLYSATAAARLLNINPARLQRWLNYGHFQPEYRALLGDVEARLLTEEEIQRLKAVMDLINGGVPVQKAFAQINSQELESTVIIDL
jgi:DNA-binding transcriptional MerR regulator